MVRQGRGGHRPGSLGLHLVGSCAALEGSDHYSLRLVGQRRVGAQAEAWRGSLPEADARHAPIYQSLPQCMIEGELAIKALPTMKISCSICIPLKELSPKVGDGVNRKGGIWGPARWTCAAAPSRFHRGKLPHAHEAAAVPRVTPVCRRVGTAVICYIMAFHNGCLLPGMAARK